MATRPSGTLAIALLDLTLTRFFLGLGGLLGLDQAPNAGALARQAPNAGALSRQATKLYAQKKYDAACPLFQQVTELVPERGAALGDYGLCLARLGRSAEAIAVTYKAISLSGSDVKTRKAAYHNLGSILRSNFPSHLPGPTEEGTLAELEGALPRCEIFDPVPGCGQRAWACFSSDFKRGGLARFARDPRSIAQKPWPESNAWVDPKTVLDGDVLVIGDEAIETYRSGLRICHAQIQCRIVWADACNGRIGYDCTLDLDAPDYESIPSGDVDVPCVNHSTQSGELIFK